MKNRTVNLLLAITILFVGFTIGFSLGRNANHEPVQLSVLQSADTTHASVQAVAADSAATAVAGTTAAPADTALPSDTATSDSTVETITEETAPPQEAVAQESAAQQSGLVNVNTADLAALMMLPGIGEVLAQRIIDYREAYGNFHSLEELTNIKGIGTKRLEAILDYATVGG